MTINKVRVGSVYTFRPVLLDRDVDLLPGERVRVINLPGCPKANTMGHCYVELASGGKDFWMVCTNSLVCLQASGL